MTTTNKQELIERIAEETNQTQTAVKKTVQAFLNYVIDELSRGRRVEFRGFGVFEIRQRGPRQALNPKTKESIDVEPRRTVRFKVGNIMKRAVDEAAGEHDGKIEDRFKRGQDRSVKLELDEEFQKV